MRFRIGEPIESRVGKKLKNLQKIFAAKEGDDRRKYIELQQAIPWVRLQSGVKIDDAEVAKEYGVKTGYDLAQKYILFGANARISGDSYTPNTSEIQNLPGYERSTAFDIRPKPGITGMSIRSHNRFGSLRTASVSFVCWSKEQIDALEVLFMRPGYSALLEWGHSKDLSADGSSILDLNLGIDLYSMEDTADGVYFEIGKKRLQNAYGYDAILGQVKNFSWSLRPDGGYDCTTELVSPGDLIESYKANFFLKQSDIQDALTEQVENIGINIKFPDVTKDSVDVPYDLVQLPQVQALYQSFIRQAETSLKKAVDNYKTLLSEAEAEASNNNTEKRRDLFNKVFKTDKVLISTDSTADLKLIGEMLDLLQIAKGGSRYGNVKVRRGAQFRIGLEDGTTSGTTSTVEWTNEASASPNSPWADGIADLNVGNNIKNGVPDVKLPDGGYVALIPSDISKFYELYNKISIVIKGTETRPGQYLKFIGQALALDSKWESPGTWAGTAPGDNKVGTGEFWSTVFKKGTSTVVNPSDNPSGDPTKNRQEDSQMWLTTNAQAGRIGYKVLTVPKPTDAQFNDGKGWIYDRNKDSVTGEVTTTLFDPKLHGNKNYDEVGTVAPIAPLKFLPMWFKGYDISDRDAGISITQEEDTLQKAQVVDNYVSKLHFYLRTFIELPYSTTHLQTPSPNEAFSSIFQYRSFETGEAAKYFSGGPSKRKAAPSKILTDLSSTLGGSFFNEDITIYTDTVYIKLGVLLELLNRHILRSDSEYFFTFVTSYDSEAEPLYFTWADHISADPRVCILPHTVGSNNLKIPGYSGDGKNRILDIELSINFILDTLNQYISDQGRVSVFDFIQALLDNIVRVSGGVNDLQLQFVEDSYKIGKDSQNKDEILEVYRSKFHIVDRKVLAPIGRNTFIEQGAELELFGLGSIIHDIRLESKLTPKISSMIAISAQDSPYTSMEESTGFNAISRGLVDRIFSTRYDIEKKEAEESFEQQDFEKGREWLKSQIVGVLENLAYFYEKAATPPNAEEQIGTYENYSKFLLGLSNKYSRNQLKRSTYNFIIPFELNVTLRGISGLKVMDAFISSQDILPKTYGGRKNAPVAFLITGVEHSVDRTGWKTNLRTQIYNIDENEPYVDPYRDRNLKADLQTSALNIFLDGRPAGAPDGSDSGRDKPAVNPGIKGKSGMSNPTTRGAMPAKMEDATPGISASWLPIGKGYNATVSSSPQQNRDGKPHNGIDISATEGAPIYSTVDGTLYRVQYSAGTGDEENGAFGNYAVYVIENGTNRHHLFGHCSGNPTNITDVIGKSRVDNTNNTKGVKVKKGDVIAYVGDRGRSSGPHLHYEIMNHVNTRSIFYDPIKHINSLEAQVTTLFKDAESFIE